MPFEFPAEGTPVPQSNIGLIWRTDLYDMSNPDLLFYHDGARMWVHHLPDGRKGIVMWVDTNEVDPTNAAQADRYILYVFENCDEVLKRLNTPDYVIQDALNAAVEVYEVDVMFDTSGPDPVVEQSQRQTRLEAIRHGYLPHHTATLKDNPNNKENIND